MKIRGISIALIVIFVGKLLTGCAMSTRVTLNTNVEGAQIFVNEKNRLKIIG